MRAIMSVFLLFVVTFWLVGPAEAQERRNNYKDSVDYLLDDGEMSPEEMEEEAIGIYNRCNSDKIRAKYYDCECVGGAFLTLRETVGPYVAQYDLIEEVYLNEPKCVNDVSIAGAAYEDCWQTAPVLRRLETNNEEYCTCVAKETVRGFESNPSLGTRAVTGVNTRALVTCNERFPKQF